MAKKKISKRTKGFKRSDLSHKILGIFTDQPTKTYNYKQLANKLLIKDSATKKLIAEVLSELVEQGQLTEVYTGKFKLKSKGGYVTGTVELNANGSAFIHAENVPEKIYISQYNLNHALQGDIVKIYLYAKRKTRRMEGEVIEVLERAKNQFVGTVEISQNFAFLITDNRYMPYDLFIPLKALKGARHGQKATARILEWPKNVKNPVAEIVEVLGDSGENDVEMHAILAEFDLPYRFSEEIETEADRISDTIEPAEIKSRRDFRKVPTFTIDPGDAKDYDDALSYKELGNGMAEIGIHIADVTHYVLPKTELDKEAYNRGTSVYLVDRVVPMLPEKLSNGVCSLRPREEKLCFSAVFEINKQGEIQKEWFGKTIIFSDRRFTYEEAQKVIDTGTGEMKEEILSLYGIAMKLREKRFSDGSIAFDRVEVKFNLDQDGAPLGVYFKENKTANQLIEEFMLLANKRVAELIGEKKLKDKKPRSFVFRIHDKPKSEKLDKLSRFVTRFGLQLRTVKQDISSSMNKLLQDVKGKNEQDLIEKLAIRAMAKAKYTTHNIGHYGLAFDYYTHFTSPIRRYPDMMVHRLLEGYLKEESSRNQDRLERECVHSSNMEQKAMNAEWASIKYKQVEFMMDKVGEVFDGIISGVAEWGLYVEIIENKCEGMIPIRELDDDFYEFDEDEYCLKGRSNLKCYRLGDPIKIEIYRTNIAKRQLDFRLAD